MKKLFVIAIGGTGMRCLESFVHLCAMGMFDGQEIDILTLDTDQSNGNKARVENLIDLYNAVKTHGGDKGGKPNVKTFFSAKLNLYKFFTDYGSSNYKQISRLSEGTNEQISNNKIISDLFLDGGTVQEFNLSHGYRAQTHLGSLLMYHAFVESARRMKTGLNVQAQDLALDNFVTKISNSGVHARVFIFGSIFGGTGASSIPVVPNALQEFLRIRSDGNQTIDPTKTKFSASLLTEYFIFNKPDDKQKDSKDDSVIADSSFFSLNSQAALQFYQNDPTVQKVYRSLYHVGWPVEKKSLDEAGSRGKVITGGANQSNGCHVVELLCACAAYDFFNQKGDLDNEKANYYYRAVEVMDGGKFRFTFEDLSGNMGNAGKEFANRFGAFLSLAHIILGKYEAAKGVAEGKNGFRGIIDRLEKDDIKDFSHISDAEIRKINEYFRYFGYESKEGLLDGWICQVRRSVNGIFLFSDNAFPITEKDLQKIKIDKLFHDEKNHWNVKFMSNPDDTFVGRLVESCKGSIKGGGQNSAGLTTTKEKIFGHLLETLSELQKFDLAK
jgi:hypothetical protein